jgi:hypothetical protein
MQRVRSKVPPRLICPAIVAGAVVVMCLRVASTWTAFNDTIDEPYHIGAGVAMIEAKRHVYGIQHPPLPRLVAAIPLVLSGVRSGDPNLGAETSDLAGFDVGHRVLSKGELPYWSALVRARAPMLLFAIAAVVYVYLLGRYLAGPVVGCIAAIFFSTDATLLGHATWVATDVAACAGYLAGTYHGLRFIARPTWGRAIGAGVAFGLAIACKFSCALVLPALGIIWLLRGRRMIATARRAIPRGSAGVLIALLTLWAIYFFDVGRLQNVNLPDMSIIDRLPAWLRRAPLPAPTAIAGYLVLAQHNEEGHPTYFNGQVEMHGWRAYFFEAIAIKSPTALIVGLVLAISVVLLAPRRRRWLRLAAIVVPLAVFLGASMFARLNIGIRHVLPVLPFLYLLVCFWLGRPRLAPLGIGLVIFAFVETGIRHPDYLSFFNLLIGGPRHGERYLLDSNLDWGQDLHRLRVWLEENSGDRTVTLRVFGNARFREWPEVKINLAPEGAPPEGLFAVSKNHLYDLYPAVIKNELGWRRIEPSVAWLQRVEPVARIGNSINIYDMDAIYQR